MTDSTEIILRTYLACERDARLARGEVTSSTNEKERKDALLRFYNSSYKSDGALYALGEELDADESF